MAKLYIIGDTEEFSDLAKINKRFKKNLISLGDIRGGQVKLPEDYQKLGQAVREAKTYWKNEIPDEVWRWYHENQKESLSATLESFDNKMTVVMGNGDINFVKRLEGWELDNPYKHKKLKTVYKSKFEVQGKTGVFYLPHNTETDLDQLLERAKGKDFDYVLVLMHEPPINDSEQPVQRKNYQFFKKLAEAFKDKKIKAIHGHMHAKETRHYKIQNIDVYEPKQRSAENLNDVYDTLIYDTLDGTIQVQDHEDNEVQPTEIKQKNLYKSKEVHSKKKTETKKSLEEVLELAGKLGFDLTATEKN